MAIFHNLLLLLCFAVSSFLQAEPCGETIHRVTVCPCSEYVFMLPLGLSTSKHFWFKDDNTEPIIIPINVHKKQLALRKIRAKDAGRYTYREHDDVGLRKKCIVYILTVIDTNLKTDEIILKSPEHSRVYLKVEAQHLGKPEWYFNGELLPAGNQSRHFHYRKARHFGLHYGSVLEIRDIRKRHQGMYKLDWIINDGCKASQQINVNVTPQENNTKPTGITTTKDTIINIYKPKQVLKAIIKGEAKGGWRALLRNKKKLFLLISASVGGIVVIASLITCISYVWLHRKTSKDRKRQKGLSGKYEPLPTIDEENGIAGDGKENNNNNVNKTLKQQTVAKYQQQQQQQQPENPFLMTSSDDATINQSAAPSPPDGKYLVAP